MTRVLHECKFITEDDFSYLLDESKWIRRLSYRVTSEEMKEKVVSVVRTLLYDLETQPKKLDLIIEKLFSRKAEHTYLIEVKLSELDCNQRKEIEACFVASVIRYLILQTPAEKRDTSHSREEFRERLVKEGVENSYADFMQNEVGSDTELTCLYRFERALLIARTYISGNRNKGLLLSVGNLLEGSDDFRKYITGGHASKETKRRLLMIERLCGLQPRKRMRKLAVQTAAPDVQKVIAGSLQFADIALSRETEDFSSLGLIAKAKEDENMLYSEYLGKEGETSNPVRIKVYNKESKSLFYREVELLKKLNLRDCVVRMIEFWENKFLISYENCLQFKISNLLGAELRTLAYVWMDTMEAVYSVHSHGVVIRHLKPENIFLVGSAHNLRVKLTDICFAQKVDMESIIPANDQCNQIAGACKMDVDELSWRAKKEEVENRLDYALLKDFMFVAPEVFTKQAGFKADVWSLGLLGLFLVKHVIPWKEVQYVQEKAEEAEEESDQQIREMLDRLSWESEVSEDTEREDIEILRVLKSAIAACLHVSVRQRPNLLEVINTLRELIIRTIETRGNIVFRESERERQCVQCLSSFMNCLKAVGTSSTFYKLKCEQARGSFILEAEMEQNKDESDRSAGRNFASPKFSSVSAIPSSLSLADQLDKTLLNGRFTIISTFLRTADYECHIIHNNNLQRTQLLKHIKVKRMQYDNEVLLLRSMSDGITIVEVEDYEEDEFQKYVAVGWLEGGWLLNVLNDYQVAGQEMSEKCLQSVGRGLVSAMKHLHGRGIIYRGLSLSRVLARRVSEDEIMVKLWDFGPAMMKGEAMSSPVGISSASSYGGYTFPSVAPSSWMDYPEGGEDGYYCMAPELLRNLVTTSEKRERYDERVDAWSVGMVLYLLVEGKSCFSVGDARSVLKSIEKWKSGLTHNNIAMNTLPFRNALVSQGTKDVITGLLKMSPYERLSWTDEQLLRWLDCDDVSDLASLLFQCFGDSERNEMQSNPPNEFLMVTLPTVKDLLERLQNMKECYLKHVNYQRAILSDDLENAERLARELSDIDESELSDSNRFKMTYSTMLESLNNAMESWKEVVMKNSKLLEQYKQDWIKKKDLDDFLKTLSSK